LSVKKLTGKELQVATERALSCVNLVYKLCLQRTKLSVVQLQDSDFLSVGFEALWKAAHYYNEKAENAAKFSTYAHVCIDVALRNQFTVMRHASANTVVASSLAYPGLWYSDAPDTREPPAYTDEREDRAWRIGYVVGQLLPRHRYVFLAAYMYGYTAKVLARVLKRTPGSVAEAALVAKRRFAHLYPSIAAVPIPALRARLRWRDECLASLSQYYQSILRAKYCEGVHLVEMTSRFNVPHKQLRGDLYKAADAMEQAWSAHTNKLVAHLTFNEVSWFGLMSVTTAAQAVELHKSPLSERVPEAACLSS
jgi:RNA polymerase sigma factor (sigma-70 family)